jgi:hypothetical protein
MTTIFTRQRLWLSLLCLATMITTRMLSEGILHALTPTAPTHAQIRPLTPHDRQRYTVPFSVARCIVRFRGQKLQGDGSTSYDFTCSNPNGHNGVVLSYTINAKGDRLASLFTPDPALQEAISHPMVGGKLDRYTDGAGAGVVEEGATRMRVTVGVPLLPHEVIITTVTGPWSDAKWVVRYTDRIMKALIDRL